MHIKSELLWGDNIRNQGEIYDLLLNGKLPNAYYLLLYTADRHLEFIPARMQSNKYFVSRDCTVFGVARGKKEACEMICHILRQIYVEHTYDSVSDYIREVLGGMVC